MSDLETKSGSGITRSEFGIHPDSSKVDEFTLKNSKGMLVKILTYGGVIRECWVPNRAGKVENVVLGFNRLELYVAKHPRFGSTIGRYANRISNAEFELDGVSYKLQANKGSSTIHGGNLGFDKRVWRVADSGYNESGAWVQLHYESADMEEGFPGTLNVDLRYTVDEENALVINYRATTDRATPVNLTNHSYFNLSGVGEGNILDHEACFSSDFYTPLNQEFVPTGLLASVENTPFDFRKQTRIGERIEKASGYDLNFVVKSHSGTVQEIATVIDPVSGRSLKTFTDQPAFQFFTANSLDGSIVGNGGKYNAHAGFCIETQHYPDSLHHKRFPNTILRPGEVFESTTKYMFSNNQPTS